MDQVFFFIKPVRHPRNIGHQQDAIIFLVETANMAYDHHTGFDVCIKQQCYMTWNTSL